jgi:putative acetyltransferase
MYKLDNPTKSEYPVLLQIWENSVRATHHFLSEDDIAFYKRILQEKQVFDLVHLTVIRNADNVILGFMGVADEKLEMLFIQPEARGMGIGKTLLKHGVAALNIRKVDVNEQNEPAIQFYKHFGFQVISRSERDEMGKPFPILHMQLM